MSNEQIDILKGLNKKKKKATFEMPNDTAASIMAKENVTSSQKQGVAKKRLSVYLSKELESEFRTIAKKVGKSVSDLLNAEIAGFLDDDSSKQLINDYVHDESINRGYNIDTTIMQKLDEFCSAENYKKRFVIECVLSSLVKKHKI